MGVNPRAGGGRGVRAGPPKLKDKHQKTKLELECLVFDKYKGFALGVWCLTPTHAVAQSAVADLILSYLI